MTSAGNEAGRTEGEPRLPWFAAAAMRGRLGGPDEIRPDTGGLSASVVNREGRVTRGRIVYWLLVGYFAVEYLRPQNHLGVFEYLHLGLVLTIALGGAWLFSREWSILREPLIRLYLAFAFVAGMTVPLAVNTYWGVHTVRQLILLLVAGVLPSVTFLAERGRLSRFMRIWVGIQALTALVAIRSVGAGPGGFLLDENDLALSLVMGLPYAYFLSRSPLAGRLQRIGCLTAAVMIVVGVIATNSRGGFLGLVGSALGILAYSKDRLRIAVLLCAVALAALPLLPSTYLDRLATMNDPTDSTRVDREYSWRRAWEMFKDNPFLGVGAGNYPWRVAEYELQSLEYNPNEGRLHGGRAAHSLYFTLLAELGLTGATVYGLLLLRTWRTIRSVIRGAQGATGPSGETLELALFARAMGASLIAFLISGTFISVLYYPHYWYLIGFLVSVDRAMRKRQPGA